MAAMVLLAGKYNCISSVLHLYIHETIIASSLIYFNGDSYFPGLELQLAGLNIQISQVSPGVATPLYGGMVFSLSYDVIM